MNYAWVIDQTKCIGCHACSTACKSENDVRIGVNRTWVKNVEVGSFPNVRRHFAVLRCNHCADPPCVHICPVRAMHQRPDGIVDIDHDRCIGCKACMQACPYDAIHIDPADNTVAKCHFCAHRIDQGLLPSCVVVCPVEALVFGDLDDPRSRVAQYLGSHPVSVRRPEQGTRPKAFYVGAHQAALDPLAAYHDRGYMWSDRPSGTAKDNAGDFSVWSYLESPDSGREPNDNGARDRTGRSRMPKARVAYDVHHPITWRGKVSSYLWTKSIAAGTAFVAGLSMLLGFAAPDPLHATVAPLLAMLALAATGVLLIADLKRPERFWYILVMPQWRSWLTKGAFVITGFGGLLSLWLVLIAAGWSPPALLLWPTILAAGGTAVYTAFLFGQCEARDLWQSPLLGIELTIQMLLAGAATLLLAGVAFELAIGAEAFLRVTLAASLGARLLSVFLGEVAARHGSSNSAAAAAVMTKGQYAPLFWLSVTFGTAAPLALILMAGPGAGAALAGAMALTGLLAYEHAFVMSGQSVPIS